MAHILGDRVKETTTTTGTGTVALAGAVSQFRAFSDVLANNDTTLYAIVGQTGTEWEVGVGTWTTGNNLARTTILASSNAGAVVTLSSGTKDVFITLTTAGPLGTLAAGTATLPPLKLQAGTLLTTAQAGALELDADALYATTDAGNRGVIPVRHFIRCNATRTLPNDTNRNAIFDNPTNGRLTLETGTYLFESVVGVKSMSATSGNAQLDVLGAGTAVCNDWLYSVMGKDATLISVAAILGTMPVIQTTPASMFTAGTGAEMWWVARGSFTVTTGGTLIPSIDQVTAAAAIVQIGSYFSCERIGSTSVVSVGQWD